MMIKNNQTVHILDNLLGQRDFSHSCRASENPMSPPAIMYTASCVAAIGGLLFGITHYSVYFLIGTNTDV